MANRPGNDKQAQQERRAEETQDFNLRFATFDLELLSLLLEQEIRTRDRPSDRLINAKEITDRMKKYMKEILDQ